jgi:hypothetical protein
MKSRTAKTLCITRGSKQRARADALALAQKDLEKHSWDVNGAGGWEHGSGEGGHLEVIDELDKDEEEEDVVSIKTRRYIQGR